MAQLRTEKMEGCTITYGPSFSEILSKDGENQKLKTFDGGQEYLDDWVRFTGTSEHVREALANLVANWPGGICDRGYFMVMIEVGVTVKD